MSVVIKKNTAPKVAVLTVREACMYSWSEITNRCARFGEELEIPFSLSAISTELVAPVAAFVPLNGLNLLTPATCIASVLGISI